MKRKRTSGNIFFPSCKKGNAILDVLTILIIMVVLGISLVFGAQIFDDVNSDIQADTDMTAEAKAISGDLYTKYPTLFDNLFLFAFVLLVIFVLVSVFMLDTHPIFFFISIVLLVCVFVVALLLGNTYYDIMTASDVAPYANQFTYMSWVMNHILELVVAIGFMVSIALYAKLRQ